LVNDCCLFLPLPFSSCCGAFATLQFVLFTLRLLCWRFDVDVPGNMVYKESRFTTAGVYLLIS
jgi:hypothetical protein